jgi:signal transduction histidine kinase
VTRTEGRAASDLAAPRRPDAAPLRVVELLVVAVVWLFFGALNIATEVLERHHDISPAEALGDASPRIFINPVLWALVTTVVLWLGRHVTLDRAFWRRYGVGVAIAAVLAANLTDVASDAAWDALAPPAVVRHEREREHDHDRARGDARRFRPGPRNLSWLDDFAVILAALAAASARGYLLRERARREEARQREARLEAESARVRADAAQLHAELTGARLDALRRQLDPHFLFNTLNAVSALVERDPRGVRRMIGQLSDLLRHSMDGASLPEIPLRDELELLARYVDIMRVRFEDQLQIETHADPRALGALVPNMILQPLVENAIKHGVEPRGEEGHVEVGATLEGDTLVLTVRDDGPGMPPWSPAPSDELPGSARGGVGLRNTAARLAQLYGETHRFTVGPAPGGGILAEIRLPYRTRGTVPDRGTTRGR